MPLSAQLSAKRQIIFPRRWAKAFREQHEAASMAIKFHLQRFLGSKTQLAQKWHVLKICKKLVFPKKNTNSAFWFIKTYKNHTFKQSLFDENCGLEDLLRFQVLVPSSLPKTSPAAAVHPWSASTQNIWTIFGRKTWKTCFHSEIQRKWPKKDPEMMWTILISWYGTVSKPCTPGEHQNSW